MNQQPLPASNDFSVEIASENSLIYHALTSVDMPAFYSQVKQVFSQACYSHWNVSLTPAFQSLLVSFDVLVTDHIEVALVIKCCSIVDKVSVNGSTKVIKLPVFYDEHLAPDLVRIAKHSQLTIKEVIAAHTSYSYHVQAIGFAPGFGYLGDIDPRISIPRFDTPRVAVPKGAVAIANHQTAIYPEVSPGGWHIIGFCPIEVFDQQAQQPLLYEVGDKVEFRAISRQAYQELGGDLSLLKQFAERDKNTMSNR